MLKRIACFGAGQKSSFLKKKIDSFPNGEVVCYIENQIFDKIGTFLNGLEVISIYEMTRRYQNGDINGIAVTTEYHKKTVEDIIKTCKEMGINDSHIYLVPINSLHEEQVDSWDDLLVPYEEFVQLYDLNIHIVDHCNLKCELCNHSSQFVKGEVFVEFSEFKKDLQRLCQLVPNIYRINLLGGEPFLHPDLIKFIKCARELYPYANLWVTTNGILLRKSSKELLDCIRENEVCVNISLYPPFHSQIDEIVQFIRDNGIIAQVNKAEQFYKAFSDAPYWDAKEMSSYCGYCNGLRNGRVGRCVIAMYTGYINQHFGEFLPEDKGIDLYDENLTGLKLMQKLEKPLKLCAYCCVKYREIDTYEWKRLSKNTTRKDILYKCAENE